uniref:Isoform 3 of Caspase-4 n=1 Tax=Homo sapiens TaxID=9606 RepID=P49662-3|nr:propeptide of Mih1/TX [Homo sapiens]
MAEGNHRKKPLKVLESLGKDFLTGVLDNLVEQNVLNWKEEEKKKYYDAKTEDKVRVMADSMQEKQRMAGQMLLQTFFNIDQISPNKKGDKLGHRGRNHNLCSAISCSSSEYGGWTT